MKVIDYKITDTMASITIEETIEYISWFKTKSRTIKQTFFAKRLKHVKDFIHLTNVDGEEVIGGNYDYGLRKKVINLLNLAVAGVDLKTMTLSD